MSGKLPSNRRAVSILFLALILVACMALSPRVGSTRAQSPKADAALDAVPILEFRSYDCKWLRYRNPEAGGGRKLELDDLSLFSFQYVLSDEAVKLRKPWAANDLRDAASLGEQLAFYGFMDGQAPVYAEDQQAGHCDADKLGDWSSDTICVPGSRVLPVGHVSLALFHPASMSLAALTTSIENIGGYATGLGCWRPSATPEPATGCGPYAPGQWLAAEEYAASGLDLPLKTENSQPEVRHYVCMIPQAGPAYLEAHPLLQPQAPAATPEPEGDDPGGSPGDPGGDPVDPGDNDLTVN